MSETNKKDYMEDISSSSKESVVDIVIKDPVKAYGKFYYKRLPKVIKGIAYIIAILNLLAGFGVAALLFKLKFSYMALSFAAILVFAVIAAFLFFIIYGIGHAIDQNNEILKKLS